MLQAAELRIVEGDERHLQLRERQLHGVGRVLLVGANDALTKLTHPAREARFRSVRVRRCAELLLFLYQREVLLKELIGR